MCFKIKIVIHRQSKAVVFICLSRVFQPGVLAPYWCIMQNCMGAKGFSVFCFECNVLSFSVDLLSVVLELSYCMFCKGCEIILIYFDRVEH